MLLPVQDVNVCVECSNVCYVTGCLDSGVGHQQLNTLLSAMDLPVIHHNTIKRAEARIGPAFEAAATESCMEAILEERALSISPTEWVLSWGWRGVLALITFWISFAMVDVLMIICFSVVGTWMWSHWVQLFTTWGLVQPDSFSPCFKIPLSLSPLLLFLLVYCCQHGYTSWSFVK